MHSYRHEVAVPWLQLAASRDAFGHCERYLTERDMRTHDRPQTADLADHDPTSGRQQPESYGVPLVDGRSGKALSLHYPDLMLIRPQGWVAIEITLNKPGPRRLEAILSAYGNDPRITAALYLAGTAEIAGTITSTAAQLGLSRTTHVQAFQFGPQPPPATAQ